MDHAYADVNGIRLHYATEGRGPLIVFAHGFPEFWYAWRDQLREFGRDHQAVAPDLRGYNLSSKPADVAQYRVAHMVEDLRALADHLGRERFVLVGHDWGGVVAWAFAIAHPERLMKLVIVNAPHPAIFEREIRQNPAQQSASRYMLVFRSPEAEGILAANDHARLVEMFERELGPRFTSADRAAYREAWSQPSAIARCSREISTASRSSSPISRSGACPKDRTGSSTRRPSWSTATSAPSWPGRRRDDRRRSARDQAGRAARRADARRRARLRRGRSRRVDRARRRHRQRYPRR